MERSISQIIDKPIKALQRAEAIRNLSGWLNTQSEDTPDGTLPEREDIVAVARKVGHLWFELLNFEMAIYYLKKALQIQMKLLGPNHTEVADLWSELGFTIGETHKADQAISCHEKSLLIRLKHFGSTHFSLAECYDGVALSLRVKRKVYEALQYHKKAISIRTLCGQEFHKNIAQSYNGIGLCYHERGQFSKAVGIYRRLTKIHSRLEGNSNIFNLGINVTYYNLGLSYGRWGNYAKAIAWHKRAMKEFEHQVSPGHFIIRKSKELIARSERSLQVQKRSQLRISRINEKQALEESFNLN